MSSGGRTLLTLRQKNEICQRLANNEDIHQLAKEFNMHVESVRRIRRRGRETEKFACSLPVAKERKRMRKPGDADLDAQLYRWFLKAKAEGERVTGPLIAAKARELSSNPNFKASNGYVSKFRARFNIREGGLLGEQHAVNDHGAMAFVLELQETLAKEQNDLENVYNMGDSSLCWKCLPKKALAAAGERMEFSAKVTEGRITVGVCANAAGTHRVPLLVVGKVHNPPCFKHCRDHLPVRYRSNRTASMTQALLVDWFENIFKPSVEEFQLRSGTTGRTLLVLDSGHVFPKDYDPGRKYSVQHLPPGTAHMVQPCDQGIVFKLKRVFQKKLLDLLLESENTLDFYLAYDLKVCVHLVQEAWEEVTADNIRNAWRRLLPSIVPSSQPSLRDHDAPDAAELADILRERVDLKVSDIAEWDEQLHGGKDDVNEETEDPLETLRAFATIRRWASDKDVYIKSQIEFAYDHFCDN